MPKFIKTVIIIFIIIAFFYFPQKISKNQSRDITGSSTETTFSTAEPSDDSDNKESLSTEIIQEETFMVGDITINNLATLQSLKEHDKNLIIYGDINPEAEEIIKLQQILQNYNKKISLSVWRTDNKRALTYNTNQTYFSACTIKIAYVLSCCKMIDEGLVDETTMLTYQEKYYHQGSGKIRKSAYGTQYSISSLIELCLSISDNVAYKMLLDYFGLEPYNTMVTTLGCDSLVVNRMWASKINVNDFTTIWNEVYNYFSSDAKMSEYLKKSCTNTPFNYGTKTLTDIDYSHKSGDNFGEFAAYNDAGIVWTDNAYIYSIFTNSEGTAIDIQTVNTVMETVHQVMTD